MIKNLLAALVLLLCIQACSYAPTPRSALINLERLDSLKTISSQQMEALVREYLRDTLRNAQIKVDLTKEMLWVDTALVLEPPRSLKYIASDDTASYIAEEEGAYMRSVSLSTSKIQVYEPVYLEQSLIMQTFRPALDTTRLVLWLAFFQKYYLFIQEGDNWNLCMQMYKKTFSDFTIQNGYLYEIMAERVTDERLLELQEIKYTFNPDFRSLKRLEIRSR